jgi:hypothetical protein
MDGYIKMHSKAAQVPYNILAIARNSDLSLRKKYRLLGVLTASRGRAYAMEVCTMLESQY